ncbi:MAG: ParB/RepB/Spo0J family partition protein [Clostridia bacterium]|nr:ParB/RepB/Spo0J family partition protein [Clostridia bacterium]MDR3645125.1 ParB/RepB/Spo0J family partition protein [Clostridia bacterium]
MFGITQRAGEGCRVIMVETGKIKPNSSQPRRTFNDESLFSLAESIRQNGILQPLSVRQKQDGTYEMIAGERRLRAAMLCDMKEVPCIEMKLDDSQSAVMALLENLQRQDLSFFEEAEGIAKLIEVFRLTQAEVAQRLGKTQSTIANKLRLLRLSEPIRTRIAEAGLTERHARALLRLDEAKCRPALEAIIEKGLNVSDTDRYVDRLLLPKSTKVKPKFMPVVKDMRLFINTMKNAVSVIKKAGVDAVSLQQENDDYVEFIVRIPKYQKSRQTG